MTVKAIACTSTGLPNSPVTEETYTFRAGAPTATPPAGAVTAGTEVTFSTTTLTVMAHVAKLCFTTDDTTPACAANGTGCQHGTEIVGPSGKVTVTEDTTYRVVACRANYEASEERSFSYDVP